MYIPANKPDKQSKQSNSNTATNKVSAPRIKIGHRPSDYTPEKAESICSQLAEGIPLAEICRQPGMPSPTTVYTWMKKNKELSEAIASAREDGEERIAVDIRNVARGLEGYSTGDVYRDKLIIETDLKLLAKWNPKKYGDHYIKQGDTNNTLVINAQANQASQQLMDWITGKPDTKALDSPDTHITSNTAIIDNEPASE